MGIRGGNQSSGPRRTLPKISGLVRGKNGKKITEYFFFYSFLHLMQENIKIMGIYGEIWRNSGWGQGRGNNLEKFRTKIGQGNNLIENRDSYRVAK